MAISNITKSQEWSWDRVCYWILQGTHLQLQPEAAGAWIIIDDREPDRRIGSALTISKAIRQAEQLADTHRYDRQT